MSMLTSTRHSELRAFLDERAHWINEILHDGMVARMGVLEETITNICLLEMQKRHSSHVKQIQFTKKVEGSVSGADWIWCIGAPGAWISLLIQAKVIDPNTKTCIHLNYRGGVQRKLLVKFARHQRLIPFYCVYSFIPKELSIATAALPSLQGFQREDWGASLISPKHVATLVAKKGPVKQSEIFNSAVPWSTIALKVDKPLNSDYHLAYEVANSLSTVRHDLMAADIGIDFPNSVIDDRVSMKGKPRIKWNSPDPEALISAKLPHFVTQMLKGRVKVKQSPISSVLVTSGIPIDEALLEMNLLPEASLNERVEANLQRQPLTR